MIISCLYAVTQFYPFIPFSLYKRDARAIFLYVQDISDDDYHIFFSSDSQAQRFVQIYEDLPILWVTLSSEEVQEVLNTSISFRR